MPRRNAFRDLAGRLHRSELERSGSRRLQPASEPITLAQDVSFVALADEEAPWPLLPVMTKEAPTNPNPLYPKNVGYQFRGYFLDESSLPTFQYRTGPSTLTTDPLPSTPATHFNSNAFCNWNHLWCRQCGFERSSATSTAMSERVFRSGRLRVTILRPNRSCVRCPTNQSDPNCCFVCKFPKASPVWSSSMNRSPSSFRRLIFLLLAVALCAERTLCAEEVGERWGPRNASVSFIPSSTSRCRRTRSSKPGHLRSCRMGGRRRHAAWRDLFDRRPGRCEADSHLPSICLRTGRDFWTGLERQCLPRHAELRTDTCQRFKRRWRGRSVRDDLGCVGLCELSRVRLRLEAGCGWKPVRGARPVRVVLLTCPKSRLHHESRTDGRTTAFASGLRSPGGIGFDEHDALFYVESQGPWNCSCS